jgi:2Fe-2S ferredoxin
MPKVTYIEFNGTAHEIDLPVGSSLVEGAVQNDIPGIVAECGGSCMCSTCHVYVDEPFAADLPEKEEEEEEMLEEAAAELKETSRLSCQLRMTQEMDGIVVRMPESQV